MSISSVLFISLFYSFAALANGLDQKMGPADDSRSGSCRGTLSALSSNWAANRRALNEAIYERKSDAFWSIFGEFPGRTERHLLDWLRREDEPVWTQRFVLNKLAEIVSRDPERHAE